MLSLGAASVRGRARALWQARTLLWVHLDLRGGCAPPARPLRPLVRAWLHLRRRCLALQDVVGEMVCQTRARSSSPARSLPVDHNEPLASPLPWGPDGD